jgi:hypothetical protein
MGKSKNTDKYGKYRDFRDNKKNKNKKNKNKSGFNYPKDNTDDYDQNIK